VVVPKLDKDDKEVFFFCSFREAFSAILIQTLFFPGIVLFFNLETLCYAPKFSSQKPNVEGKV